MSFCSFSDACKPVLNSQTPAPKSAPPNRPYSVNPIIIATRMIVSGGMFHLRYGNTTQDAQHHDGSHGQQGVDGQRRDHQPADSGGVSHGVGGAHVALYDPWL